MFTSVVSWVSGKAKTYLAVAGAVILAIAYAFMKGRASGTKSSTESIVRETQRVNEKFQKIDSQRPDFDGAIGSLRKRSQQDSKKR